MVDPIDRIKRFYRPRVQVPQEFMLNEAGQWGLVCLPLDGISLLKRIIEYGYRRVTYVASVIDEQRFYTPNDENWALITEVVARTEEGLAMTCQFDDIVSAIDANTAAITALQCICENLSGLTQLVSSDRISSIWGDTLLDGIDDGRYLPSVTQPTLTIGAQSDSNACAIAQLYYAFTYETMTEIILPSWRAVFDDLLPLLAGAVGTMTGGPAVGIAVYGVAELLQELIEVGYDIAESNLINWMLSAKDDWVCTAYNSLLLGGTNISVAGDVYNSIISPSGELSFGDKAMLKLFGGPWALQAAYTAHSEASTWAINNVVAGYCDDCNPVVGFEFTGTPCATATLVFTLCTEDTASFNSGNGLATPGFTPEETGDYRISIDIQGRSTTGNTGIVLKTVSPDVVVTSWVFYITPSTDETWSQVYTLNAGTAYRVVANPSSKDGAWSSVRIEREE